MALRQHHAGMHFTLARVSRDKAESASKFDKGKKGYLTFPELSEMFVTKKKGVDALRPEDMREALAMLGLEDLWPHYLADWTPIYNSDCCVDWRGNFHFDGIGAGNVKTGRRTDWSNSSGTELFVICINFDMFSTDYLLENLNDGNVVLGPSGFPEGSTPYDGYVTYYPRWRLETYSRFYTSKHIYPNQLQVSLSLADALNLANAQGLSIYGQIQLGATTMYINRDSVPFANFDVPRSALLPAGSP